MREFAHEAKMHGLLFVPMRDKTDPDHIEIAILADDASKVNRIFDRLQLDVVDTGMAEAVDEVAQDMEAVPTEAPDTPQKEPQKEEAPVFPFPARRQTEPEPAPSVHAFLEQQREIAAYVARIPRRPGAGPG